MNKDGYLPSSTQKHLFNSTKRSFGLVQQDYSSFFPILNAQIFKDSINDRNKQQSEIGKPINILKRQVKFRSSSVGHQLMPNEETSDLSQNSQPKSKKTTLGMNESSPKKDVIFPKVGLRSGVLSGQVILERSKHILRSIRPTKEIFQEAFESKSRKLNVANTQYYGQERMRNLAKRLHVMLNFDKEALDESQKTFDLMKQIPLKYYHALRKQKKQKETLSLSLLCQEDQVKHNITRTSKIHSFTPIISSKNSPVAKKLSPKKIRRKSTWKETSQTDIEAHPFLNITLNDKIDENQQLNQVAKTISNFMENKVNNQNVRKSIRKEQKDYERNLWITRTAQINKQINDYISDSDSRLSTLPQEKSSFVFRALETNTTEQDKFFEIDSSIDPIDDLEIFKEIEEKNFKVEDSQKKGFCRKQTFSNDRTGTKDALHFYKYLIFKEQNAAIRTMQNVSTPKPKVLSQLRGGRKLFN